MTATALPPIHATYQGGTTPDAVLDQVFSIIEHGILNDPRTLQKEIGPSEVGMPCTHCLAAKLAGWEQTEQGVPWLTFVGRAVHEALSNIFISHEADRNATHTGGIEWLSEQRVTGGWILSEPVPGSCDLFHVPSGTVVDFKVVGAPALRRARSGPTQTYRYQGHTYGQGWANAGYQVDTVAILYLPRNAVSLGSAVRWHEPFDPTVATEAFERASHLQMQLNALRPLGDDVVNGWITGLDRDPDCFDCSRYPDRPTSPVPTSIDEALT